MATDCDNKILPSGHELGEFSIAYNVGFGDRKKGIFAKCKVWGKKAQFVHTYLGKGSKVFIEGELNEDSWEDRETGKAIKRFYINISEIKAADSKKRQAPQECYEVETKQGGYETGYPDATSAPTQDECPF